MSFNIALGSRVRKSPFHDSTVQAGVTMFSIYNHMYMPVSYGDLEGEYWRLIEGVSMWDVAAERQVQLEGPDAGKLAQYLTPRNLSKLRIGVAMYLPMCDHQGVLINDPILLKLSEDRFWFSIADTDMIYWVKAVAAEAGYDVVVTEPDVSLLAVQGPKAVDVIADLFGDQVRKMRYFHFTETQLDGIPLVLARTGWSKQGGFELFLQDGSKGNELWDIVAQAGKLHDIGPGTPNYIERVESALLSHGGDNDPESSPFEFDLGRYVDLDQKADFIGKQALKKIAAEGPPRKQIGIFIEGSEIFFNEHPWPLYHGDRDVGKATVACYSPRLKKNIALALVSVDVLGERELTVETPEGRRNAVITEIPFF